MEAGGFALGVVGLAGLYGATCQVLEQISSASNFGNDVQILETKFDTAKASLLAWGNKVGLSAEDNNHLQSRHNPVFNDARILQRTYAAIACIKNVSKELQEIFDRKISGAQPTTQQPAAGVASAMDRLVTQGKSLQRSSSFAQKLRWGVSEKKKTQELLDQILALIGLLYQIASPRDASAEYDAKLTALLDNTKGKYSNSGSLDWGPVGRQ